MSGSGATPSGRQGQGPVGRRGAPPLAWSVALLGLGLGACGTSAGPPLQLEVDVVRALDCRPTAPLRRFELDALGAGPFEPARRQAWSAGQAPDPLPADVRQVRLRAWDEAGWEGLAAATLAPEARSAWLLLAPPDRSCPLADPALAWFEGAAAVVQAPAGRAWLLGGLAAGTARRQVVRYEEGRRLATMEPGLALRRAWATATAAPGGVLVAGGMPGDGSVPHDTVERLRPEAPGELLQPPMLRARAGHAALWLPAEEALLLVGGEGAPGAEPWADAERWAPGRPPQPVTLPEGRTAPSLWLDGRGDVWLAGGRGPDGAPAVGLWRLPAGGDRFEVVDATLPALEDGRLLPLGRHLAAWVGRESDTERVQVHLVRPTPDGEGADVRPWAPPLPPLRTLRVAAASGGRLLLVGAERDGRRFAAWLQPEWSLVARLDASRAARRLLVLPGGAVLEVDGSGASLRQVEQRSPWDEPPASWVPVQASARADEPAELLGVAGARWRLERGRLEATRAGGLLEVAELRFEGARIEVGSVGAVRLRLETDGGLVAVRAENGALRLDGEEGCEVPFEGTAGD